MNNTEHGDVKFIGQGYGSINLSKFIMHVINMSQECNMLAFYSVVGLLALGFDTQPSPSIGLQLS